MISRTLSLGSTQKDLDSVAMGDLGRVAQLIRDIPDSFSDEMVLQSLGEKATRVEFLNGDYYTINFVAGQLCVAVITTVPQLFAARRRFHQIRQRMIREGGRRK